MTFGSWQRDNNTVSHNTVSHLSFSPAIIQGGLDNYLASPVIIQGGLDISRPPWKWPGYFQAPLEALGTTYQY